MTLLLAGPYSAFATLSTLLKGIKHRYAGQPGLTIPYEREIMTKTMSLLEGGIQKDVAAGIIYFKPPRSLRIQQEIPRIETIITDGVTLWWYIPEKNEVYKYPSHILGKEIWLLSDIFQGLREVTDSFEILETDSTSKSLRRLTLVPRPPWPDIDHITLDVDPSSFDIRTVEIVNIIGGITRFTLEPALSNDQFRKDFFRFDPPQGTQIIEEAP
jgi:outer membrane lipoprotein carrier protein